MNLYLGCSQWGWNSWKGGLYPENVKPADYLHYYAKMFNTVELNPTYHDEVYPKILVRWKASVSPSFKFCPKFPKAISHDRVLKNVDLLTKKFINTIKYLDENLGICFLQLPQEFQFEELPLLEKFLQSLPKDFKLSVELRENYLRNDEYMNLALDILKENKAGIVMLDGADTRKYLNRLRLTNHTAFIRFLSYNHPTDFKRIDDWIKLIAKWNEKGIEDVYFFLHFPDEFPKPDIAVYTINKFKKHFKLDINPNEYQLR